MPSIIKRLERYWSTDRSLTALVILLVFLLFVLPPFYRHGLAGSILFQGFFMLVVISGVLAATRNRLLTFIAAALSVGQIVTGWMEVVIPSRDLLIINAALSAVTVGLLAAAVMVQTLREGPITAHRILGAVAVYMLLGLMWAIAYDLIETSSPGAFQVSSNTPLRLNTFIYYSFVTLTTVGYGDVIPLNTVARSLANLEALVGQLFPAILIARLVSMELYYRQKRHP